VRPQDVYRQGPIGLVTQLILRSNRQKTGISDELQLAGIYRRSRDHPIGRFPGLVPGSPRIGWVRQGEIIRAETIAAVREVKVLVSEKSQSMEAGPINRCPDPRCRSDGSPPADD